MRPHEIEPENGVGTWNDARNVGFHRKWNRRMNERNRRGFVVHHLLRLRVDRGALAFRDRRLPGDHQLMKTLVTPEGVVLSALDGGIFVEQWIEEIVRI